jgi:hypothetical protein
MARYREQKLEVMNPEERTDILERIRGVKNAQHFTERKMFIDMIKSSRGRYQTQAQIKELKKQIRGELRRYKELTDDGYDSFEGVWIRGPFNKDEKIFYGSDSDSAVESFGEESDERVHQLVRTGNNN